ncbi:solute carrier family 25 protein [archaeon]|nr:MAG: solute carrier family 25 protein [archaeon]
MSAPLMGVTPIFAVCFWAYDAGKQLIRSMRGMHKDAELSLFDIGVAGAASAIPTTAIMAPGERIKCILQVQDAGGLAAGQQRYAGPGDVVKRLVRSEGITSLFRGSLATLLRDGSGSFAYFAVYEAYKRHFTQHGHAASASTVLIGGGLAGVFNWIVALPLDVVKSRIQIQTGAGASTSILAVARQLVKEEGVAGLYRGSAPALLRAFPANAACFMGMELSMAALNKLF